MSEHDIIQKTIKPITIDSLINDLRELGVKAGDSLLLHSSLSSMGWVCGGELSVIEALIKVVTDNGNIIMPTHTGDLTDPTYWQNPPVPHDWIDMIKSNMPPFDAALSPTRLMGRVPELFRKYPDVRRSNHPHCSFCAWGHDSEWITANHLPEYGLGKGSPLQKCFELDAKVLLLGVGYDKNTSFHLAEYLLPSGSREVVKMSAPFIVDGVHVWKEWDDIDYCGNRFEELGADFEKAMPVRIGTVGQAMSRLFSQRDAVLFAAKWL